ncbi:MAG: 30S ribosomal protein S20 [bacterium]
MANNPSAEKRIRQNEKRRVRNKEQRSKVRTICKNFEELLANGDKTTFEAAYKEAASALDRAAIKGIIPQARASRKKSRLAIRLSAALA